MGRIGAGVLGVVDESSPPFGTDGSVVYVVALAVLRRSQIDAVGSAMVHLLDRRRPLHWEREGTVVRERVVDQLCRLPVRLAAFAKITARASQNAVRRELFERQLLPAAVRLGVDELRIETRSEAENNQDRQTVRSWFRDEHHRIPTVVFATKEDPLTWIADATAGIVSDALLDRDHRYLDRLIVSHQLVHFAHERTG